MFGLENVSGQIKGLVDTSIKGVGVEFLKSIPGYGVWSQFARKYVARKQGERLGKREDASVVDRGEINSSFGTITRELGGTYNPLRIGFNFGRRILGSSSIERAGAELGNLESYADLYDAHMFANETVKFLLKQAQNRISDKEGLLSKLGFTTNKKLMQDPVLQRIMSALKAWASNPYQSILHGGVEGVGFTKNDWEFLGSIRDQLLSGKGAKYLKPVAGEVQKVLNEAKQMYQARYSAQMKAQQQAEAMKRRNMNQGQELAQAS